eukprot:comp18489_c0_seq2/m.33153 comp18489_c0_seq2/g.33153  ORF comp18489_c0_seq2/g.33153 comp18489_c0_seq2/m.33153 type:complete len:130 (+) comp18489_c0_seq2:74-463(+)
MLFQHLQYTIFFVFALFCFMMPLEAYDRPPVMCMSIDACRMLSEHLNSTRGRLVPISSPATLGVFRSLVARKGQARGNSVVEKANLLLRFFTEAGAMHKPLEELERREEMFNDYLLEWDLSRLNYRLVF